MPSLLAALGERLPPDHQPVAGIEAKPVAELVLALRDPKIQTRSPSLGRWCCCL